MRMTHSFHTFVSETPQRIESLGETTTQERRPATRGGVRLRALAKHGQPVAPQWISIPLPGGSLAPSVNIPETPFGGF